LSDFFNVRLSYAMGITDIDDKIIAKAKSLGYNDWPHMRSLVRQLENDFFRDMDRLNVQRPDSVLRVTEHIPDILRYIQQLIDKGSAYVTQDGVYFNFSSLSNEYDKFGCANVASSEDEQSSAGDEGASSGAAYQSSSAQHHKRSARDFALWKLHNQSNTDSHAKKEVFVWDSPWGAGRPGWHIECSAMTHALFGPHIDIHSGGVDLKFPHHTNEIAQWYVLPFPCDTGLLDAPLCSFIVAERLQINQ
jgi:cysteinyl-tRNA synthetase